MKVNYSIKVDEQVIHHMKKKKKTHLTVTVKQSGGGCCPTIEVADVDLAPPSNQDLYNLFHVDDISVYVSKSARVTAPVLRLSLEKSFFINSIVPQGLSLKGHS